MKIVDTSAILDNPFCADCSEEEKIVPMMVIEELDYLKDQKRTWGRARAAIRQLKGLARSGDLVTFSSNVRHKDADDQVIEAAGRFGAGIVSSDLGIFLKAHAAGITCSSAPILFPDIIEMTLEDVEWEQLFALGCIKGDFDELIPNQCVQFRKGSSPNRTALGMVSPNRSCVNRVEKSEAWGVSSRNMRQHFLLGMLMDPDIKVMTVTGDAGSGKTYLTIAAALEQVLSEKRYRDIVITRPFVEAGPSLGHLPGELNEKMAPWMEAVTEVIAEIGGDIRYLEKHVKPFTLTHARGRTVKNSFWLIDEASNFSHEELKTLLTRAGEGTKVVLTGDLDQCDRDDRAGGLQAAVFAYRGESFFGHIGLEKTYRGDVCRVAMERL